MAYPSWFRVYLLIASFILVLMTLISLGLVGRHQSYYRDLLTKSQKESISKNNRSYIDSMNAIMVFGSFWILYTPVYVLTSFNNSFTCHKISVAIYFLLIWLPRWIANLVFLEAHDNLRKSYKDQAEMFEDETKCEQQLASCALANSYVSAQKSEVAHGVLFFLFGLSIIPILWKINKSKEESEPQANNNQNRQEKYEDREMQ